MKKYLLFILSLMVALSCEKVEGGKENGGNGGNKDPEPKVCTVSGFAQKGQLAKGSQVTAFATGADLIATGESFPANISDDRGSFSITGKTVAPYLELRVDGYYFDEIQGGLSSNPLFLEAFVESSGDKANLNLMTTAIKLRVKNLIKSGKTFKDANSQAQSEFLSAMGVSSQTSDFYDMDITKGSESDAVLLAVACMMQNGRDASGVSTLVQEIASDLESDGRISDENIAKVKNGKDGIDIIQVISNLDRFYQEKGMTDAVIPRFYGFIDERLNKDFAIYQTISYPTSYSGKYIEGASFYSFAGCNRILSQKEFTVETDCDWITVDMKPIVGPAYEVSYYASMNSSDSARTGHIIYKGKDGDILESEEFTQGEFIESKLTLYVEFDIDTKGSLSMSMPQKGDLILVNQKLEEVYDVQGNCALVETSPAPFFRVSWPAENMGFNMNPAYVVKTFPAEVPSSAAVQYYGARTPMTEGEIMYDDTSVRMKAANALVSFNSSAYPDATYAVISGNTADDCLSGTATYVWVLSDLYLIPSLVEFYSFENKSNSVKVTDLDNTGSNYVSLLPQTLPQGMTIELYDADGNVLLEKRSDKTITLSRGTILNINL